MNRLVSKLALVLALALLVALMPMSALAVSLDDMKVESAMELKYATGFSVEYLEGGYKRITDGMDRVFVLVPEGAEVPEVGDGITVLQAPLTKLGCFSTTHAVLLNAIGALDKVTMVTTDKDKWYLDQIKTQMDTGKTVYVGKSKEPDFELISTIAPDLTFVTANTSSGSEELLAKFDELGIKWCAALEHLENNPLGRVEWAKLAGALLDKEAEAEAYFNDCENKVLEIENSVAANDERPSVSQPFIYKGVVYIRNDDDCTNTMIEMAGGKNATEGAAPNAAGTSTMSMEDYYAMVSDVDVMIYDTTSDINAKTISDIVANGDYLADIKAIKDGNVWGIRPYYYQHGDDVATMIKELNTIMYDPENATDFKYYYKLEP